MAAVAARRAATAGLAPARTSRLHAGPARRALRRIRADRGAVPPCGDITADDVFAGCTLCYFAPDEDIAPDPALVARARDAGALVNVADHPNFSDFIIPSVLDRSPLIVAISTGGDAPLLGRMLKARLETLIPAAYGRLAEMAGESRAALAHKLAHQTARLRFWERIYEGPVAEMVLAGDEAGARGALAHEIATTLPDGSAPTPFHAARSIWSAPGRATRTCSPSAPSA